MVEKPDLRSVDAPIIAERFMRRFSGAQIFCGYNPDAIRIDQDGKVSIKVAARNPEKRQTTLDDYLIHREGMARPKGRRWSLGSMPIDRDNMCCWGAIDIDDYTVDVVALQKRITEKDLPLIVCRSKSGGAHCFLFMAELVPAHLMQFRLTEIAAALAYGGVEIFPKQREVDWEGGDVGSWLNLPYFGDERPAYRKDGTTMPVEEFLDLADEKEQPASWLEGEDDAGPEEAPPADAGDGEARLKFWCDQLGEPDEKAFREVIKHPKSRFELHANNQLAAAAFDLARYCRDVGLDPERAKSMMLAAWRARKQGEARSEEIFEDVWERQYKRGWDKGRPAKKSSEGDLPDYERVWVSMDIKDEPIFMLQIGGKIIPEITMAQWYNQDKFNVKALESIGRSWPVLTGKNRDKWRINVEAGRGLAEPNEFDEGVTRMDSFMEVLNEFLTDSAKADSKDEILQARPWLDDEAENKGNHRYYFRLKDLIAFLGKSGMPEFTKAGRKDIAARIRKLGGNGGDDVRLVLKGDSTRVWWVPASFFKATPRIEPADIEKSPI